MKRSRVSPSAASAGSAKTQGKSAVPKDKPSIKVHVGSKQQAVVTKDTKSLPVKNHSLSAVEESSTSLTKTYLSVSHENLSSSLRRRANTAPPKRPRPLSWVGPKSSEQISNIPIKTHSTSSSTNPKRQVNFADIEPREENIVNHITHASDLEVTPIRKANSVQNLKSDSQTLSQASSIDNLCRPTASSLQKKHQPMHKAAVIREEPSPKSSPSRLPVSQHTITPSVMAHNASSSPNTMKKSSSIQNLNKLSQSVLRRAQSSQNVSNGSRDPRSSMRNRASTPSNALAYNAELLAIFEKEKKSLESRISELVQITESRKAEIEKHKIEIRHLRQKIPVKPWRDEVDRLRNENKTLRGQLEELGVHVENGTPFVNHDTEEDYDFSCSASARTPLYHASSRKSGSSACLLDEMDGVSIDLCGTPEPASELPGMETSWERQSSKSSDGSCSEVSLACLQEKISRMEESQYSTNEELQATLQELGDLQRNVNQLAEENEQLGAERMVLLQSLCTQTEKLENARTQIEHLKALILSDTEHSLSEREQELVNLLKGATEEREELLLKQCEIHHALESFDLEYKDMQERVLSLTEQCKLLEEKRRDLQDEKKEMESHMAELEEELANERIELERYKTLLENEKGKVLELQQLHKAEDKSELEQLLENTRADKEKVEQRCANLQETLAHSRRELGKTKEQLQLLEEELILARNNNKTCLSDLEYKYDKVSADRGQLEAELRDLREKLEESRKESNRLIEENRSHRIAVSDLQAELKGAKHRYIEFEKEMKALSQRHEEEASDWKQFQSDLQTAVVIANAIKAEAVEDKERLIDKNNEMARQMDDLQKQLNSVQAELERVKAQKSLSVLPTGEIKKHLLGSDRELAALRQGRRLSDLKGNQNIVSVKTLIKSIEGQGSLGSSTGSSRRGSSDSLNSPTTVTTNFSNHIESSRNSPERRSSQTEPPLKSALKKPNNEEKQRPRTIYDKTSSPVIESLRPVSSDNSVSSLLSMRSENDYNDKNFDPLAKLVKQTGGSKRNALLKWCQLRTRGYSEVDVTNFSSSWNDGLAFCALLHNYIPDKIPFDDLCAAHDKRRNFTTAFQAAESVGIPPTLNVNEMVSIERPDWQTVMSYVTSIYTHFECD